MAYRLRVHVHERQELLRRVWTKHWHGAAVFRFEHMSIVDKAVRAALDRDFRRGLVPALLGAIGGVRYVRYGQHDVGWVAGLDAHRRVFAPDRPDPALDLWTALARSCGWWWPGDGECVVAERPSVFALDDVDDAIRPHRADGPAVRYPDGWSVHFWHGTAVPAWVIEDPTPERIDVERNAEVRRCAIEHLGWPAYLERSGSALVATAPDPGNQDAELRLYDLPAWAGARMLLAVNGSLERDGTRRRYGLRVPRWVDSPLQAAAWTYGLTTEQYATLLRRT
ncbi:hypothetical protein V5P93_004345 [Actinokineospora auranticolor]|uniref:DUF6745 domain-containing protein n=1 Tax=Actinokineospora auranticolor TaxID=155976 RepID=A0A2S6GTN7_9PSEU|nr:hypothetical protein [Actinokineospora auranticolor]PPK68547.1 hypothetical protein CLV40_105276 [Actinokineospora auranticolor]